MTAMTSWPDVESVLVAGLGSYGTCGTETPPDLQNHLPFVRIKRRGGTNDQFSDYARVDIDVFAETRAVGVPLTEEIRQYLLDGWALRQFDWVVTESGPQELPWDDPNVRRWVSTYRITARRTA